MNLLNAMEKKYYFENPKKKEIVVKLQQSHIP